MVRNHVALVLLFAAAALGAQEATPSPRETLEKFQTWAAQDHVFTSAEVAELEALEPQLDADRAGQARLLRLALTTQARANEALQKARTNRAPDEAEWLKRDQRSRDQGFWRATRNVALGTLTLSTVSILGLAAALERAENTYSSNSDVKDGLRWCLAGSVATAFLSLFPLAWGEARQ